MATETGVPGTLTTGTGIVVIGDESYTMLAGDTQVGTSIALTAARVVTLPKASTVAKGTATRIVVDYVGGVTSTNTLSITPYAGDTINGSTSSVVLNAAYAFQRLRSNGVTGWVKD